MEISLTKEKYSLIKKSLWDFGLKSIQSFWDGHGGLEFEFFPEISDKEIQNNLKETLSEIIEETGISWNLNIEIASTSDLETLLEFTEIRNLSEFGDITFENSDFLAADVCNYILINHGLNIDDCECVVSYSQTGYSTSDFNFSSEQEFTSQGNFSFVVLNDEDQIDVSGEELEKIIGRVVHNYIINNCSMCLSFFNYNFEFIDGELNDISLTLSPKIITLKTLN
ncbi:MAG: hypothetical protein RIT38_210 [Bacteroidota bacterium]|jgi:hypothetical protein